MLIITAFRSGSDWTGLLLQIGFSNLDFCSSFSGHVLGESHAVLLCSETYSGTFAMNYPTKNSASTIMTSFEELVLAMQQRWLLRFSCSVFDLCPMQFELLELLDLPSSKFHMLYPQRQQSEQPT